MGRRLFVPQLAPIVPGVVGAAKIAKAGPELSGRIVNAYGNAQQAYNALPEPAQQYLKDKGKSIVSDVADKFTNQKENKPMNSPYTVSPGDKSSHSSGYALSGSPNPLKVKLDTGITPNAWTSDSMDTEVDLCSPLHVTSARLQIPLTDPINLYFKSTLTFALQARAQEAVGFRLDINTIFTADNIFKYMNDVLYALQVYFYYKSITTYYSYFPNKNEGMMYLRSLITPQILDDLSTLERRLQDTPVPPRLLEMTRYLSMNYMSGNTASASLLKLVPNNTPTCIRGADLTDAINGLRGTTNTMNNEIGALLRRAVGSWSPRVLYDIPLEPVYDPNFMTLFANLPYIDYNVSTARLVPTVLSTSDPIVYCSYTDSLDGAITAMLSAAIGTAWSPGFLSPIATLLTPTATNSPTRRSYYTTDGINKGFFVSELFPILQRSRPQTYVYREDRTTIMTCHLSGTDLVKGVSINSVADTSKKLLDYLMSLDTIKASNRGSLSGRNKR